MPHIEYSLTSPTKFIIDLRIERFTSLSKEEREKLLKAYNDKGLAGFSNFSDKWLLFTADSITETTIEKIQQENINILPEDWESVIAFSISFDAKEIARAI